MITGTPYAATREDLLITVYFVEGELSTSVSFKCVGDAEAVESIKMWTDLIESAIHNPVNKDEPTKESLEDAWWQAIK